MLVHLCNRCGKATLTPPPSGICTLPVKRVVDSKYVCGGKLVETWWQCTTYLPRDFPFPNAR